MESFPGSNVSVASRVKLRMNIDAILPPRLIICANGFRGGWLCIQDSSCGQRVFNSFLRRTLSQRLKCSMSGVAQ